MQTNVSIIKCDYKIFIRTLENVLPKLKYDKILIIFTDDFNIDFSCNSEQTNILLNLFRCFGFHCKSCIDNLFVNFYSTMCCINTLDPYLSDQHGILLNMSLNSLDNNYTYKFVPQITQTGLTVFKYQLALLNWEHIYANEDSEFCFNIFHWKLLSIFEFCFPYKQKKISHTTYESKKMIL